MTVDWTKFRDGDRVRVTLEGVWCAGNGLAYLTADSSNSYFVENTATSAELITPEIVTGAAYVDADGKAYLGGTQAGTLIGVGSESDTLWVFGSCHLDRPLPAGLRRAKVVPE